MIEVSEALSPMVAEKLAALRESLADDSDGLPSVTMSLGVAFSGAADGAVSLFKAADSALYYVKEHGRDASRFYGDEEA